MYLLQVWSEKPQGAGLILFILNISLTMYYIVLHVPATIEKMKTYKHTLLAGGMLITYLPSHYITVTQFQYILTMSIAWEFATN